MVDMDISHVLMLGSMGVGKTSMVNAFLDPAWSTGKEPYTPTRVGQYRSKTVQIEDRNVTMNIFDVVGDFAKQDLLLLTHRHSATKQALYPNAAAAIVVFDVTSYMSLLDAETIVNNLRRTHKILSPSTPIVLAGNKGDLKNPFDQEMGKDMAEKLGAVYIEVSAKTGRRIERAFTMLAEMYVQKYGAQYSAKLQKEAKIAKEKARKEAKFQEVLCQKFPVSANISDKQLLQRFPLLSAEQKSDAVVRKWQTLQGNDMPDEAAESKK